MDTFDYDEIHKYLDFLTSIMTIKPNREVIDALLTFWDPKNNVFYFLNFELTPTVGEIVAYVGYGDIHRKKLIAPRLISINKVCKLMNLRNSKEESIEKGWVSLQFLYDRYGRQEGFKRYGKQLCNKGNFEAWKVHRRFAFMIAFLGTMVFPRREQKLTFV